MANFWSTEDEKLTLDGENTQIEPVAKASAGRCRLEEKNTRSLELAKLACFP
jgi:hypothetical protein